MAFTGQLDNFRFAPELRSGVAGKRVLITGAGSGLGRALAIECARAGASVILSGRNGAKLDRVYDEIEAMGAPQPAIAVLDLAIATAVDYDRLRGRRRECLVAEQGPVARRAAGGHGDFRRRAEWFDGCFERQVRGQA